VRSFFIVSHHPSLNISDSDPKAKEAYSPNHPQQQAPELLNFAGNPKQDMPEGIPIRLTDYLELVESFVSPMRLTLRAA
jgi:hypothetical protein